METSHIFATNHNKMKHLIPFDFTSVSKNAVKNALQFAAPIGGDLFYFTLLVTKNC
jgi:hypothetical protein